jgi:hypothetical protein
MLDEDGCVMVGADSFMVMVALSWLSWREV